MDGLSAKLKTHHRLQGGPVNPEASPWIPIKFNLGMSSVNCAVVRLWAARMGWVVGVGLAGPEDIGKRPVRF